MCLFIKLISLSISDPFVAFSDINNNDANLLTSGSFNGKDLKYKYDRKYLSTDNAERRMKEG